MPCDNPGELYARQNEGIQAHMVFSLGVTRHYWTNIACITFVKPVFVGLL
jgi:hypothetical protein